MLGETIEPEIHELIDQKDFATLKSVLAELDVHDVADLMGQLRGDELGVVFRLLPRDRATQVFAQLELDQQEHLTEILSGESLSRILNNMPPDDRTELLEELPEDVAQRLLGTLSRDQREVAIDLLRYPEHSIGRLMTPEYVAVPAHLTVREVLEHIRQVAPRKETLNMLFVIDGAGRLVDEIRLEDLVLADPDAVVGDIIDRHPVYLEANEDREVAVEIFMKYDEVALPVVDEDGVLVGIVTHDDVMDVQEEENTEDFHKMGGVGALEHPYFSTSYSTMIRKRLPCLLMLSVAGIAVASAVTTFERSIGESVFILLIFLPLLNDSAGNTGSQASALMVRGFAVHEVQLHHWPRVAYRELRIGFSLGVALAALAMVLAFLLGRPWYIAISLGLSMTAALTVANVVGALLPFVLKAFSLDPAVISGPLITSVMDVLTAVIYFSVGLAFLTAFG
ncbi:MAG: magnesium transporter [Planctomycetales bacterium 4484_123]|nr:MAG: magnesium transporter [Planctomycetales bacterium 4484_123]